MKWNFRFAAFLVLALLASAGCSVFPGLKVLSGQDTGEAAENRLVESSDLVMANKAGTTDPVLSGAADRIELASGSSIDIIEIRNDLNTHEFKVYALMIPPDSSATQQEALNQFRRAIELTWRGIMQQSIGAETLTVELLFPGRVSTLDKGPSYLGVIGATATISRPDALVYLNASPSLQNFVNLILDNKMAYDVPSDQELYSGTPNHPVFMLSSAASTSSGG
jgi:hypothetical protein